MTGEVRARGERRRKYETVVPGEEDIIKHQYRPEINQGKKWRAGRSKTLEDSQQKPRGHSRLHGWSAELKY